MRNWAAISSLLAVLTMGMVVGAYADLFVEGFSYQGIGVGAAVYYVDLEYGDIVMNVESPEGGTLTMALDTTVLAPTSDDSAFVTADGYPADAAFTTAGMTVVIAVDVPAGTTEVVLTGVTRVQSDGEDPMADTLPDEDQTGAAPPTATYTPAVNFRTDAVVLEPPATYSVEMTSVDGHTFVFAPGDLIRVIDVTRPSVPLVVAHIPVSSWWFSYVPVDGAAYLAAVDVYQTLHILDVTIPYRPIPMAALPLPQYLAQGQGIADVDWASLGERIFVQVSAGDAVLTVEITDPRSPTPVGGISSENWRVSSLDTVLDTEPFWAHGYSYVAVAGQDAVQIVSFGNPASPVGMALMRQGQYGFEIPSDIVDMDVVEADDRTYALIMGQSSVTVAEITDPSRPTYIRTLAFSGLQDMDVVEADDVRYALLMGADVLYILDITNPGKARQVASTAMPAAGVAGMASDGRLWALSVGDTVAALDITDPAMPIPAYVRDGGVSYAPEAVEIATIGGEVYAMAASPARSTIQITKITDPHNPVPVSEVAGGQHAYGAMHGPHDVAITKMGNKAYAVVPSIYSSSVTVLDVTDPRAPTIVSAVSLPMLNAPTSVAILDIGTSTYAAVAGYYSEAIRLVDITDPYSPRLGTVIQNQMYGFEAVGDPLSIDAITIDGSPYILAVSYYDGSVQIIDVADPDWPRPAAIMQDGVDGFTLKGVHDISVARIGDGTFAVVASSYDSGITTIDITNPRAPSEASHVVDGRDGFENLETVRHVDVVRHEDRTLVVATSYFDGAMQLIDITDPRAPVPLPSAVQGNDGFESLIGPVDVEAASYGARTYVVAADYFGNGIQIAEITDGPSLSAASTVSAGLDESLPLVNTNGIASVTVADRTYALTTAPSYDVVQVTDITNPRYPVPVSLIRDGWAFEMDGPAGVVAGSISGKPYAFVTGLWSNSIQVIDMEDPAKPEPAGVIQRGLDFIVDTELVQIGQTPYLVVGARTGDVLQIIDVSNPSRPAIVSATPGSIPSIQDLDVISTPHGVLALLISFDNSLLYVLDITDPANPRQVSEVSGVEYLYSATGVDAVSSGGRILAVVSSYQTDRVSVLDITDPANPTLLSSVQGDEGRLFLHSPESVKVATIGDRAIVVVANGNDSLQLADITDPYNPVRTATTGTLFGTIVYGATDAHIVNVDGGTYVLFQTIDGNVTPIADATNPYSLKAASMIPPLHQLEHLR